MIESDKLIQYASIAENYFVQQNIERFVTEFRMIEDIEIMAISACWLNIGIRDEGVAYAMWAYNKFKEDESPLQYVLNKSRNWTRYQQNYSKFTSSHTLHGWWQLMGKLYKIYSNGGTILDEVVKGLEQSTEDPRDVILQTLFELFSGVSQMPTTLDYLPNKFVRFVMMMVRPRPIATGVWSDKRPELINASMAYIPLNSELIKVISDNGLVESPNMSWEFGKSLVEYFSDIFPDDPTRGYLSIIGLKEYANIDISLTK